MTSSPTAATPSVTQSTRKLLRAFQENSVDRNRITDDVRRALVAEGQDPGLASGITELVELVITRRKSAYIHAEEVRDITARALMQMAVQEQMRAPFWFKVASRFVLQSEEKAADLEARNGAALVESGQTENITVRARDGSSVFFDRELLRARVQFALAGLDVPMAPDEIEADLRRAVREGMTALEVRDGLIQAAAELQLVDTPLRFFAARFLLSYLYEEILGWDLQGDGGGALRELHRRYFKAHVGRMVDEQLLDSALLAVDLDRLAAELDPSADYDLDYLAAATMRDRFLLAVKNDGPARFLETPQFFYMRVALGCSLAEAPDGVVPRTLMLYRLLKERRMCPSPVVLMNAGRPRAQLAQSVVYWVPDSIRGIFLRGIVENSLTARSGATVSGNWTGVRGTGAFIAGTNGESQGLIPFLKLHNDQLLALAPDGRHPAEGLVAIEPWHNDVLEFLELRIKQGDERRRTTDLSTAILVNDLFMRRVEARGDWTFFRSSDVPDLASLHGEAFDQRYEHYEGLATTGQLFGERTKALEVWKKILKMAFETGFPRLIFKDSCSRRAAVRPEGTATLCGARLDVCLPAGEDMSGCSFQGVISLPAHCDANGTLSRELLRETVRATIRAMDNLVAQNVYPTEVAKRAGESCRSLALSLSGLDELLARLGVGWDTAAASAIGEDASELFAFLAIEASAELANERGAAPHFVDSLWAKGIFPVDLSPAPDSAADQPAVPAIAAKCDWPTLKQTVQESGLRNLHLFSQDGAGVEGTLLGCSPGFQPRSKHLDVHKTAAGDFCLVNPALTEALKRLGEWDDGMRRMLLANAGSLEPGPGCPTEVASRLRLLPEELKRLFVLAPQLDPYAALVCAARRGRWMDGAEAWTLWIGGADMALLSRVLRATWHLGFKSSPRLHFGEH